MISLLILLIDNIKLSVNVVDTDNNLGHSVWVFNAKYIVLNHIKFNINTQSINQVECAFIKH